MAWSKRNAEKRNNKRKRNIRKQTSSKSHHSIIFCSFLHRRLCAFFHSLSPIKPTIIQIYQFYCYWLSGSLVWSSILTQQQYIVSFIRKLDNEISLSLIGRQWLIAVDQKPMVCLSQTFRHFVQKHRFRCTFSYSCLIYLVYRTKRVFYVCIVIVAEPLLLASITKRNFVFQITGLPLDLAASFFFLQTTGLFFYSSSFWCEVLASISHSLHATRELVWKERFIYSCVRFIDHALRLATARVHSFYQQENSEKRKKVESSKKKKKRSHDYEGNRWRFTHSVWAQELEKNKLEEKNVEMLLIWRWAHCYENHVFIYQNKQLSWKASVLNRKHWILNRRTEEIITKNEKDGERKKKHQHIVRSLSVRWYSNGM